MKHTSFSLGATGSVSSNPIHYNAAGQRINGGILFNGLAAAKNNSDPTPSVLTAVATTDTSVTVSFEGVGAPFTVVYKPVSVDGSEQSATTPNNTVMISNLLPETQYSFQVRSSTSPLSNNINVTTIAAVPKTGMTTPTLRLKASSQDSPGSNVTKMSDSDFEFTRLGSSKLVVGQVGAIKTVAFTRDASLFNNTLTFGPKTTWMIMFSLPTGTNLGANSTFLSTKQGPNFLALNTAGSGGNRLQQFNSEFVVGSTTVLSNNKWYAMFAVWDGSANAAVLYLNGSVISSGACANNIAINTYFCLNGFTSGSYSPSYTLPHHMVEVAVWRDTSLTPAEITARTAQLAVQYGVTLN